MIEILVEIGYLGYFMQEIVADWVEEEVCEIFWPNVGISHSQ